MNGQARRPYARTKAAAAHRMQPEVDTSGAELGPMPMTSLDASTYLLSMVAELRALAKTSGFRFLTYLLEMAFQEAFRLTSEIEQGRSKRGQTSAPEESAPKA